MTSTGALRLAWWNTRLCELAGNSRALTQVDDPERWRAASHVVRALSAEGKDVLVLGEVTAEGARTLANESAFKVLASPNVDPRLGIFILHKHDISVEFKKHLDLQVSRRDTKMSDAYEIYLDGQPPLLLIPSHWPAQGQPQDERDRNALGADLQIHVDTLVTEYSYIVLCGDFNDEPFDYSMSHSLRGTRDRSIARGDPGALYNPFWRLLGERESHTGVPTRSDAGTYYCVKNRHTTWYTFDQFLVSQKFIVEQSDWQLCESETQIWNPPFLRRKKGIAYGFDHYPVAITIEAQS